MHAETVLFVDHGEHQVAVVDRVLEQRMGADDDLCLAGCNPSGDRLALLALGAAGQHLDRQPGACGKFRDRRMVLARQDFGRRHQHGLATAFDGGRHGE